MDNQDYNNQNYNGQDYTQGNDNPNYNQGYDNQQNYNAQQYEPQPQQYEQYNAQPQQYEQYNAQSQQYNAQPYQAEVPQQNKNDGKAIASLVLGICSLALFCCWGTSIATGIVGLVLGILSKKSKPENNTMATAGIVLSVIGVALGVAAIIYYVVIATTGAYSTNSLYRFYR